eukprot:1827669-Pleurochrysis_carterae.AAC.1
MKKNRSANMRRSALNESKTKSITLTSCFILLKRQLHARRALSKCKRGACGPMEGSTRGGEVCGLLTSF